jgi:hypothetical protein
MPVFAKCSIQAILEDERVRSSVEGRAMTQIAVIRTDTALRQSNIRPGIDADKYEEHEYG